MKNTIIQYFGLTFLLITIISCNKKDTLTEYTDQVQYLTEHYWKLLSVQGGFAGITIDGATYNRRYIMTLDNEGNFETFDTTGTRDGKGQYVIAPNVEEIGNSHYNVTFSDRNFCYMPLHSDTIYLYERNVDDGFSYVYVKQR